MQEQKDKRCMDDVTRPKYLPLTPSRAVYGGTHLETLTPDLQAAHPTPPTHTPCIPDPDSNAQCPVSLLKGPRGPTSVLEV